MTQVMRKWILTYSREIWKTIPFEDNYDVSNLGNVRNNNTLHIKSLRWDRYGYLRVTLYPSGKTYTIHRLVGLCWLAHKFTEDLQIDHIDNDRSNNILTNLEWVSPQENVDRIPLENRRDISGSANPMAVIDESKVMLIKYNFIDEASKVATEYNVSVGVVENIRRRERWVHLVDEDKEALYQKGELTYKKGKTANMSKDDAILLELDIVDGVLDTKMLADKYGVSRSAIFRRKRKMKHKQENTNELPNVNVRK